MCEPVFVPACSATILPCKSITCKVKLPEFLQQKLKAKKGKAYEIPADFAGYSSIDNLRFENYEYNEKDGIYKGEHDGAHFYTIGQRKGIGIGGSILPLFVIKTDTEKNIIYLGQGENHPGLFRSNLKIENNDIHWINSSQKMNIGEERKYMVRIRYRQDLTPATLQQKEDGLYIHFEEAQRAVASGQFAAWYEGNVLVGSGVIG